MTNEIPSIASNLPQPLRIFVINLDEDRERLEAIDAQLAKLGLGYERFPAFRGAHVPPWLRVQFFDEWGQPNGGLGPGEIGCYASHLAVWQKIIDEALDGPVLVLEDDVEFAPHFLNLVGNIARLPSDWEIIRCINPPTSAFVPVERLGRGVEVIRYWRIPVLAGAYFVNRAGAARLLARSSRRSRAVDDDLRRFWEIPLKTYGLIPPPFTAPHRHSGRSTIDRIGGRRSKVRSGKMADKAQRLAAALKIHGPYVGARCILANFASSILRRAGASDLAVKALRVVPRSALRG